MNGDPILPEHDKKYMRELVKYVHARKTDYKNNTPGIAYWDYAFISLVAQN